MVKPCDGDVAGEVVTLTASSFGCTKMACSREAPCCNSCEAYIVMSSRERGRAVLEGFTCRGDDSAVCCDLPLGEPVRVTGKSLPGDAPRFRLESVCLP